MWPSDAEALRAVQQELAAAAPEPWTIPAGVRIGGCWVCFPRGLTGPGGASDPSWAVAVVMREGRVIDEAIQRECIGLHRTDARSRSHRARLSLRASTK